MVLIFEICDSQIFIEGLYNEYARAVTIVTFVTNISQNKLLPQLNISTIIGHETEAGIKSVQLLTPLKH